MSLWLIFCNCKAFLFCPSTHEWKKNILQVKSRAVFGRRLARTFYTANCQRHHRSATEWFVVLARNCWVTDTTFGLTVIRTFSACRWASQMFCIMHTVAHDTQNPIPIRYRNLIFRCRPIPTLNDILISDAISVMMMINDVIQSIGQFPIRYR